VNFVRAAEQGQRAGCARKRPVRHRGRTVGDLGGRPEGSRRQALCPRHHDLHDLSGEKPKNTLAIIRGDDGRRPRWLVRIARAVRHGGAAVVAGEFAGAKLSPETEPRNVLLSMRSRLKHGSSAARAPRRTRFALYLERAGRHMRVAHLTGALELDGADHRTVGQDAGLAARTLEAGVV